MIHLRCPNPSARRSFSGSYLCWRELSRDDAGWLSLIGNGDVPAFFLPVNGHDDDAGRFFERDGGVEEESAIADLGDGEGLAVDVEADADFGGVAR